jgi:hypothetical protein
MANYEVVTPTTGLNVGDRVTEEQIKKDHPGLSFEKLVRTGGIKIAEGPAKKDESKELREQNYNTGSPLPLSKDQDQDEAIAQNLGQGAPDTAERKNPRTGGPGTVTRGGARKNETDAR